MNKPTGGRTPTKEDIEAMHRSITPRPKPLGVTVGMCMNNATQLVLPGLNKDVLGNVTMTHEDVAKAVMNVTEALLDEMHKRGL